MKILVTGGAGFIGSHTVDALLARGHDVRVLDSLEPPVHTGSRPEYLPREVELVVGSVTNRVVFTRALEGVEAVFHFAAYQLCSSIVIALAKNAPAASSAACRARKKAASARRYALVRPRRK